MQKEMGMNYFLREKTYFWGRYVTIRQLYRLT